MPPSSPARRSTSRSGSSTWRRWRAARPWWRRRWAASSRWSRTASRASSCPPPGPTCSPRRSAGSSRTPSWGVTWARRGAGASRRSSAGPPSPSAPSRPTPRRSRSSSAPKTRPDRVLAGLEAFVFDLDGCVWNGDALNPGAGETLAALVRHGRRVAFLSNNSRATGADLRARLHRLGVSVAEHVLTPLEIIGAFIAERHGPSRVLVMGAGEMADVVAAAGHEVVTMADYRRATVVAVGNDFELTYDRLTAAARAVAAGAALVTPN